MGRRFLPWFFSQGKLLLEGVLYRCNRLGGRVYGYGQQTWNPVRPLRDVPRIPRYDRAAYAEHGWRVEEKRNID